VLDFGSRAPVEAFRRAFASAGVDVSEAEARAPMGLPKAEHLRVMGTMPRVAGAWRAVHGVTFGEADVQRLLEAFVPVQAMVIREHADLVPGAAPVVAALRARGIKIGSTTGYPRAVMGDLRVLAAAQGFDPDAVTCGDDLPETRPSPLGFWRCLIELGAWPACACVKVDDTVPGLMEGRNAGAWTVAVLASGNAAGIDARTWDSLTEGDRNLVRARARASLSEATPDFMIDTVADLLPVVDEISKHGSQRRSHPTHTPSER
jgi:phosphonoacetaldehyde hydrolase